MEAHVIADGFVVNASCLCWVSFLYPTYVVVSEAKINVTAQVAPDSSDFCVENAHVQEAHCAFSP